MGKGGGGGQPTSTTAYQTNLPEYAKPYVMNMLGAAQNQLFTTTPGKDGEPGEITGFKPYTPYSTDPTAYFAGPSGLQKSAYGAAGNLQSPTQYQAGTQLATAAGMGGLGAQGQAQGLMGSALGYGQAGAGYGQAGQLYGAQGAAEAQRAAQQAQQAAGMYGAQGAMAGMQGQLAAQRAAQQAQRAAGMYGQQGAMYGAQAANLAPAAQGYGQGAANIGMQGLGYGAQGAGYGQQAANMAGMGFGAGQQYTSQVTNPNVVSQYMSPYMQNVVDTQKAAAVREAQIANQASNLASARSGTYGGARQALAQAERERGLLANLSNIQAQGSQNAYNQALQNMQYGANLGLQGLQAGYQGLSQGMQGAQTGLSGLGTAMQGQQAGLAGLQQAGSLYGQGMQGAQAGLSGVGQQLAAGQLGLSGAQAGMQGAGVGLSGVGQQLAGGQLGLQGTAQGIQGAQAGMQGAGVGLSGVQGALGAGQYGLQGLSAANAAAGTLGQLGTSQQAADINAINLQNQLGQQQQAYQQNIINQAIQDYATAQQYPYMQLSTMSNLLRGLPMQSMSTQQYQAQAPLGQQAAGLLGAYGAYKGAFKEGGAVVPGYKSGVLARVDNTLDDLADAGGIGALKKRLAETSSPKLREEIQDKISELSGIARANVGDLGRNMAGGGIIAFEDGGEVQHFYDRGKVEDPDNPYGYSGFGEVAPYDPRTAIGAQFAPFERLGNAIYGFGFKTKHQIQEEVKAREKAAKAGKETDSDYQAFDAATAAFEKERANKGSGAPAGGAGGNNPPTGIAGAMPNLTGYKQAFYDATGIGPGPGVKNQALMSYLEGDQSRLGERYGEAGRINKALAILEGAQDPRGLLAGATTSGKAFLKGEAELQKQRRAEEGQIIKMQADVEAAREAKARGDFDAYSKHMESAAERQNKLEVARIGAAAHGAAGQYKEQQIKNIQAAYKERTGKDLPYDAALSRLTELQTTSDEAKQQDMVKSAFIEAQKSIAPGGANYKEYKKLLDKDPEKAKQYVTDLATRHYQGMQSAMAAITGGGNPSGGKPSVSNW